MVDPSNLIDLEDELEKKHVKEGYQMGYEKGQLAGQEEGYSQGLLEGAKRGSEVGFYGGSAMTLIQLLKNKEATEEGNNKHSTKILTKLNELLELVENFPKENETLCEDKLNTLRIKYKHVTSMLNIKLS